MDWNKHFFNIIGLFDTSKDIVMSNTYSNGSSYNRSKIKERQFNLNGVVKGLDNFNNFKRVMNKSGLKKLTVTYPGMPTFYLMVDFENYATDSNYLQKVSLQVVAPDPNLYANDAQEIVLGNIASSGFIVPVTLPVTLGIPTGSSGILINYGNETGYPLFKIIGTCSNIIITNETTGESMTIDVNLNEGDELIIDNIKRSITLNGVKRMDIKSGNWISCVPGRNSIGFARTSLQDKQHAIANFRSVWL